ncbi:MAG: hypothetical protein SGARI_006703, partial [Bacillariaceae sp.]
MKRVLIFATLFASADAFSTSLTLRQSSALRASADDNNNNLNSAEAGVTPNRRSFLSVAAAGIFATMAVLTTSPSTAFAKDELFKGNPLTNSVLEQIRIWEQAEADNIKYGGELEMGDAGNKGKVGAYPSLLVPILKIDQELGQVKTLVHATDNTKESWAKALEILQQPAYDKIAFKKTFNKYGDNIYYSDPDRANVYLGGGATPKTEQSLAYLLRNDVLTNMENLRAELEYLLKTGITNETEDLFNYADIAASAMKKYLAIVPPNELSEAQKILS